MLRLRAFVLALLIATFAVVTGAWTTASPQAYSPSSPPTPRCEYDAPPSCTTPTASVHNATFVERPTVVSAPRSSASSQSSFLAAKAADDIPWGSWNDYAKVTVGGRTYAQVGDRLYTRHAVDRMQPSGLGTPAGGSGAGRSIAPNYVEDVIRSGSKKTVTVDGVRRTIHTSGSVQVVTERRGRIVVTVNPFSGG